MRAPRPPFGLHQQQGQVGLRVGRPLGPGLMMARRTYRGGGMEAAGYDERAPMLARALADGEVGEAEFLRTAVLMEDGGDTAEGGRENAGGDDAVAKVAIIPTFLLFIFPAIGGMLFGYDIGATSGALAGLKGSHSGVTWAGENLNALQTGLVASASLYGALFGSAAVLVRGNAIGRRQEMGLAAALYIGGALATYWSDSLAVLVLSRGLYGLGIGVAMHVAPIYIAECAPPAVRGALVGAKEAFIVAGILLGYFTSYVLNDVDGGWRYGFALAAPLATVLLDGVATWLPESPRYTLLTAASSGEGESAVDANARLTAARDLAKLRGANPRDGGDSSSPLWRSVAKEMRETEAGAMVARENTLSLGEFFAQVVRGGAGGSASTTATRRALKIGLGLMLFQQITGQPSVLYYASDILADAGFDGAGTAQLVAVGLGAFKLLATASSLPFIDSAGRRPLLLIGIGGLTVALALLGAAAGALGSGLDTFLGLPVTYASVAALLMYVASYQISFGPISWLIVGEVFPLSSRNAALACATLTNFGANAIVALVLPTVQRDFGQSGTYFLFCALAVASWVFVRSEVPETKGRSLEEIERALSE